MAAGDTAFFLRLYHLLISSELEDRPGPFSQRLDHRRPAFRSDGNNGRSREGKYSLRFSASTKRDKSVPYTLMLSLWFVKVTLNDRFRAVLFLDNINS